MMKTSKSLLFTGFFLLTIAFSVTEGRKNKGKGRGNKSNDGNGTECLGEPLQESKLFAGLTECTEELVPSQSNFPEGISDDDKIDVLRGRKRTLRKNHMCIKMCQRKRQGILDSKGAYSESGAENFVSELFPQKAKTRIQRQLTRCGENFGEKTSVGVAAVSDNCKEYRRFEKCLMRSIAKSCGWKNGKTKGNRRGNNNKGRRGNNKDRKNGNQRVQSSSDMSDEHIEDDDIETEGLDF